MSTLERASHGIVPVTVAVCATVLGALHVIDSATAVILLTGAGGWGAVAVSTAKPK